MSSGEERYSLPGRVATVAASAGRLLCTMSSDDPLATTTSSETFMRSHQSSALHSLWAVSGLVVVTVGAVWATGVVTAAPAPPADVEAAAAAPTFSIGDRLWIDLDRSGTRDEGEPAVPDGVVVDLRDADGAPILDGAGAPITASTIDGRYLFEGLIAGRYIVEIDATNFARGGLLATYGVSTGPASSADPNDGVDDDNNGVAGPSGSIRTGVVDLAAATEGGVDLTVDIGLVQRLSIGDRVWHDRNGNGRLELGEGPIPDVVVELLDGTGTVVATTLTDLGGKYRFDELEAGTYRVRVPIGNFGSGRVLDAFFPSDGPFANQQEGVEGNSDGRIVAGGVESGDVTLVDGTEMENDGSFDDSVDFGFYSLNVRSTIWSDVDLDGFRDERERGIPRVIGRLLDAAGTPVVDPITGVPATTVSDRDGVLSFRGLREGDYIIEIPAENFAIGGTLYEQISTDVTNFSADGTIDDDDNGVPVDGSVRSGVFRLVPGTEHSAGGTVEDTVDFGMVELAAVGGRVWRDDDRDGVEDEPGVGGVTVELLDGGRVLATTTTDGGGNYLFSSLRPGTYSIQFVVRTLPAGYVTTLVDVGDDQIDSDAGPDGLVSGIVLDVGEVDRTIDLGVYPGPVGGLTPMLPATGRGVGLATVAAALTLVGWALLAMAGDGRRRPSAG